ncbi:hypothetical protein [Glaciibacter psychrotolerans]|uniref:Uncharacterized protein n=1 Tax=Glaciibacter psychrotolerans TaxID=670054 RepID=A0A7Z0EG05_9MICO|nr:hypothetical protein [Leifsonia psychrotolerans]NYJ20988.1 hypothetical protein [Leifsonia psychrotolerans]
MYLSIWRVLPGPVWLRILFSLILIGAALFALATWVFPWIDAFITSQEVTVGGP